MKIKVSCVVSGEIKVSCEGFDSSTDTYHLAGSCGVIWKKLISTFH